MPQKVFHGRVGTRLGFNGQLKLDLKFELVTFLFWHDIRLIPCSSHTLLSSTLNSPWGAKHNLLTLPQIYVFIGSLSF